MSKVDIPRASESGALEAGAQIDRVPYLLVAEGTHDVHERIESFAYQRVKVMGTLIEREGRRMIEVVEAKSELVTPTVSITPLKDKARTPRTVSMRAEIVDGKCFLGVMKLGEGKGH